MDSVYRRKQFERVLVLNASWEPLTTVAMKRAIVLVLEGKAEVVEERETTMSSSSRMMARPAVIRLVTYVKVPFRARTALNRTALMERDSWVCQFSHCDRKATTIDHVHPRSKGGKHAWENVVAACRRCNAKKADKTLKEIGWKLKREPKMPVGRRLIVGPSPDPLWEPYLTMGG